MKLLTGALALSSLCECARILAIVPISVKSHFIVMEPLLQELAARGHSLTVYSNFPQRPPLANYTDVDCSSKMYVWVNNFDYEDVDRMMGGSAIRTVNHIVNFLVDECATLYDTELFDVIHGQEFDLVIAEMFGSNCYVHFAQQLGAPLVSVVTSEPLPWTPDSFGLPDNPAYIPSYLVDFGPPMTFYQRMVNTAVVLYAKVAFEWLGNRRYQELAERHWGRHLPPVSNVASNSSLLLVNSHLTLSQSRPLPPNVVEIGGIHIKEPKPLPQDLQGILAESASHGGAILLSFGTMLRVSTLPPVKLEALMRAFSRLPQTVLFKYEAELLTPPPPNVVVRKWLPQRDILEHSAVVAVVTHGGMASVMEAVHCAKPIIGVPFFADQGLNVKNMVRKGVAILVEHETMTEDLLTAAFDEIVNNSRYRTNMKLLSEKFRDRPMSALQSAVFWTEYVIRHRGAPHLRPASVGLPFYQYHLLDVVAVFIATLYLTYYILGLTFDLFNRRLRTVSKQKTN